MVAIRRFIDVIFVEPKHRQYVILHKGKFWQLPRMNLTLSAWELKEPYTGSLNDIFVIQSQAVGQQLSSVLRTYELPEQLSGLPATHFLAWWETNDYKWLSEQNVVKLNEKPPTTANNIDNTTAPKPPTPSNETQTLPDDEMLAAIRQKAKSLTDNPVFANKKPEKTTPDLPQTPSVASPTNAKPATSPTPETTKATPQPTPPITPPKKASGDVFDDLLGDLMEDLNNELLHKH